MHMSYAYIYMYIYIIKAANGFVHAHSHFELFAYQLNHLYTHLLAYWFIHVNECNTCIHIFSWSMYPSSLNVAVYNIHMIYLQCTSTYPQIPPKFASCMVDRICSKLPMRAAKSFNLQITPEEQHLVWSPSSIEMAQHKSRLKVNQLE